MSFSFLFSKCVSGGTDFSEFCSSVMGVAFHPNDNTLASCSQDKSIKLWNFDTGAELSTMRGHSEDNTECICEFHSWGDIKNHRAECPAGHSGSVRGVCFSPNGCYLSYITGKEKTGQLWSTHTGENIGSRS